MTDVNVDPNVIDVGELVKEDMKKVGQIFAMTDVNKQMYYSEDMLKAQGGQSGQGGLSRDKVRKHIDNIYDVVIKEFSEGTCNSFEQIKYLDAFSQAVSVFRQVSKELRENMGVDTLESMLSSQANALSAYADKHQGNGTDLTGVRAELDRLRAIGRGEKVGESKLGKGGSGDGQPEDADYLKAREDLEGTARDLSDAVFFSNRYALNFAGQVGLALLDMEQSKAESRYRFGDFDNSQEKDELASKLASFAGERLSTVVGEKKAKNEDITDDTMKEIMQNIFTSWINQFNWDVKPMQDIASNYNLADITLRQGNFSMKAGEFKRKYDVVVIDDKLMNVTKDDCIGAEGKYKDGDPKLGSLVWNAGKILYGYNHDTRKNVRGRPPFVIFSYGEPGCGKTFISHAYMRSLANQFRDGGKPIWIATHSVTDYASHFQNQTANALQEWGNKIRNFPGVVIAYIADADMVLHSRQDPNMTVEQMQTTSVYMKMFDGTMISKKDGRVMFIMDANYIDNIDPATQSRIFDKTAKVRNFENPSEWAALSKMLIAGKYDGVIPVTNPEWDRIGEMILDTQLSTREVTNVLGQVVGDMEWPEDKWYCSDEESVELVNQHLSGVTYGSIVQTFDKYCSTRHDIANQSTVQLVTDPNARFKHWEERKTKWLEDLTKDARQTNANGG